MEFLKNLVPSILQIVLFLFVIGLVIVFPFVMGGLASKYFKNRNHKELANYSKVLVTLLILAVYLLIVYRTLLPPLAKVDLIYTEVTGNRFPPKARLLTKSNTINIGENLQDYKIFTVRTIGFAALDSIDRVELLSLMYHDTSFINDFKPTGKKFEYLNGKFDGKKLSYCFVGKDTNKFKLLGFLDDDSTIVFQKGF